MRMPIIRATDEVGFVVKVRVTRFGHLRLALTVLKVAGSLCRLLGVGVRINTTPRRRASDPDWGDA